MLCILSSSAADNIYVYRNDGRFNAFFSEEVDSMRFSNIGIDGINYDKSVTQEIYTPDSIYRIPLSVIDSISVYQPKTLYKPDVRVITDDYLPFISSSNNLSIEFLSSLPEEYKPKEDEILVRFDSNEIFPDGFAGRVKTITTGDHINVACDSVGFLDIYDQLITIGEFTLEKDPLDNDNLKAVTRSSENETGELPLDLEIPISLGAENLHVEGKCNIGLRIRLTAKITPLTQFIELRIKDHESISWMCEGEVNKSKSFQKFYPDIITLNVPIPQFPIFKFGARFSPFIEFELKGKIKEETTLSSQNSCTFTFSDGQFNITQGNRESEITFKPELSIEGSIWGGMRNRFELSSIGNLLSIGGNITIGPKITGNISADLEKWLNHESAYEILNDTKLVTCLKGGIDFSFNFKWKSTEHDGMITKIKENSIPLGKFSPSIEIGNLEFYLFPNFSALNADINGTSLSSGTTASRSLIFPSKLGFALTEEDGRSITKYNSETYWLERFSDKKVSHTFDDLKHNVTYTLQPIINIFGIEIKGSPSKTVSIGARVYTSTSDATYTSATTICSYDIDGDILPDSYGICYSKTVKNPDIESGTVSRATSSSGKSFMNDIYGLEQGTTYYYRGFINLEGKYIYGDTRCFTTKRLEDPDEEPNPGGTNGDDGTPLEAITVGSHKITQNSACIRLSFSHITTDTDCGYFLDSETSSTSGGNSQMVSLGPVAGNITIPLSGLKPSTTYYYQAYAKNKYGKSIGEEMSFTTDPLSVPTIETIEVSDVKQRSANVEVEYSNLPDEPRGGIELTSNGWSYALYQPIGEGKRTFTISNLEPGTKYSVCGFADYDGGTAYGNEIGFTTEPREIPDLSGKWTFHQKFLGNNTVYPELELKEKGKDWARYTASGFYGVILFEMTVYSDLSVSLYLGSPNSSSGHFSGMFDENFTSVSGNSYIYDYGPGNWAVPPTEYNDSWSFSR